MRRAQAVAHTDRLAIQPDPALPVTPFEKNRPSLTRPLLRDRDLPLIPGGADVVLVRREPEGHLDIARFAVRLIPGGGEPRLVDDGARPRRLDGHFVAKPVLQHGLRQPDTLRQLPRKPLFLLALAVRIRLKPPRPGQGYA